jgi:hypothetical protein
MTNEDIIENIIIFFIIVIIVVVVILIIKGFLTSDYPETKIIDLNQDTLKTGDIVIVGYNNVFGKIVKSLTSSVWTHSGVLWRDPKTNFLYVIELCVYKKLKIKGIAKVPFDIWIELNKKHNLGLLKYSGSIEVCSNKMDEIFKKYENIELDKFNYKWYRFLYTQNYKQEKERNIYTCFEFTIKLLQEVGVYKKNYLCSSYFPGDIGNNNIKTNLNFYYQPVIKISYDKYLQSIN